METYVIEGGHRLSGEVSISGAKNAVLGIIAAAVLHPDTYKIENVPHIKDVDMFLSILKKIGVKVDFKDNILILDTKDVNTYDCSNLSEEFNAMRASYYLLGAFLGRFGKAKIPTPGGCTIGKRPIDQHLKGFKKMGAEFSDVPDLVDVEIDEIEGCDIYLDCPSVGATINLMIGATLGKGKTTIFNAAKEPHIVDVANFLNLMGADIKGAGTDVIIINGVDSLHGCEHSVIPDQITTGTYMIAAAATEGDVRIKKTIPTHMQGLIQKLKDMGVQVEVNGDEIHVVGKKPFKGTTVITRPYPGFPTDLQQPLTALLTISDGKSVVVETMFENRFKFISELQKMGADCNVYNDTCIIEGVPKLSSSHVKTPDLRAGAALVIAALAANGTTVISDIDFIDRGYENFEQNLTQLGAKITREEAK